MDQSFQHIVNLLSSAEDPLSGLRLLSVALLKPMHAQSCQMLLVDSAAEEYVKVADTSEPDFDPTAERRTAPLLSGLLSPVVLRGEPLNLPDVTKNDDYPSIAHLLGSNCRAALAVPLIHQGELLGLMLTKRSSSLAFSEEEEAQLVTISVALTQDDHLEFIRLAIAKVLKRKLRLKCLTGIPATPGVGLGKAVVVYPKSDLEAVPFKAIKVVETEILAFKQALDLARKDVEMLSDRAKKSLSVTEQVLFDAYLRILDSRSLMEEIVDEIQKQAVWAQYAVKVVIKRHVLQFEQLDDAYLRERADDFKDLGRRILAHLQQKSDAPIRYPKKTILVSDELTATALMEVPREQLVGVVSSSGAINSHVAILTRAMGVPAVLSAQGSLMAPLDGKTLIVDGHNGEVHVSPAASLKKTFHELTEGEKQFDETMADLRDLPAETKDKHRIALLVNTGLMVDGGFSISSAAEGVGLYRTELPFMMRQRFPSEEEQRVMYRQLLNTFSPKRVVMRTLDIGGDKSLPYFKVKEDNPFLGWRGIRISLDYPQIFLQQLKAMIQASEGLNNLAIMFPMISSMHELDEALRLLKQAYDEVVAEGYSVKMPKTGLMIEVPSAVYQAKAFAKKVNFLSVGSNDLIQYLLAVDRNNARVADLYEGLHPAVLKALKQVVSAGHQAKRAVSICGELAGDPVAAILLLAMGYDSLSMNARSLPKIKWVIRAITLDYAKSLLKEVLKMDDAMQVQAYMETALSEAGLADFIWAGRR